MKLRSLFNEKESYNALGNEIQDKAQAFVKGLLDEYPDVVGRDMIMVLFNTIDIDVLMHGSLRHMQEEVAKEKAAKEV